MTSTMTEAELRAAIDRELPGVRADLERLVRIPGIAFDGFDHSHLARSAEAVAELLRGAGMPDVRVARIGEGHPAVIGRRPAPPGAPTVLLYAHHDVQPVGDLTQWMSDPFEPVERAGRLYGRGAADDKAGVMAHVAALRAFGDSLPVGVVVFAEGEEEYGSDSLEALLREYRDHLAADVILIADSVNWDVGRPALTTTLRGIVNAFVEVRTLDHAVHSGAFGGAVPDALTTLCRLLATMHDDAGDVAVAGLVRGEAAPLEYLGEPCVSDGSGPAYDAVRAAFTEAWDGTPPVDIGVGGSIPFIATFREMFPGAAILVTGVEDPDGRAHGPNESLHLGEFARVCLAEALLLAKLGALAGR